MRDIHFSHFLEKKVAEALYEAGIEFVHESEDKELRLDFYLPLFDVFIEIKHYHADRISRQMSSQKNVIAIQGTKSVELLIALLKYKITSIVQLISLPLFLLL